jgi:cyclophilin family peptidyl-prolyl cis-trans isomerase
VESLETRCLLAAPVIDPITGPTSASGITPNIPAGKSLIIPITATDTDGNPLTYSVSSSNPQVSATLHPGGTFLKVSVQNFGDMVFQLFPDIAPNTVNQITGLVNRGFYNGLTFHRVVPNFVIQAGSTTDTTVPQIADEFNLKAIFTGNGQLAMANAGPDTNTQEFFVTLGPQRSLDFNHPIFGQLVRGFDVLQKIDQVPINPPNDGSPITPVVITSATIFQDTTDQVLTLSSPAGQSSTITVTVDDGHGGSATQSFTTTAVADATNDPPFLNPVQDQTTPRNTPVTFNLSGSDLENDPLTFEAMETDATTNATVNVSGSQVTVTPTPGFTGAIKLLVGVADQGATTRGSRGSSIFDTHTMTVTVTNTDAPLTGKGRPISVRPGQLINAAGIATFTDADPTAKAADFTASIDWGDGTTTTGTVTAANGGGFLVSGTHTYNATGSFTATITVTDNNNPAGVTPATTTITDAVTVANVDAPIHAQGTPVSAAEGVAANAVTVATFTDEDPNVTQFDFPTTTIDWGDGTAATSATITAGPNFTFNVMGTHTYTKTGSFPVTTTIRHNVTLPNGITPSTATATSTATVTSRLTAFGGSITVAAGTPITNATVATLSDADFTAQASNLMATIDWGDGTTSTGTVVARTGTTGAFNITGSHTYTSTGTFNAVVTIKELTAPSGSQPETTTATNVITITNRLAAQGGSITASAGIPLTNKTIATFTDADTTATANNFTATIDWGDGTTTVGTISGSSGNFSVAGTHTYSTTGTFTALATVKEINAPAGTQLETASATNVIMVISPLQVLGGTLNVDAGVALNNVNVATFTDANAAAQAGDFSASINWGDGTTTPGGVVLVGGGNFAVTGTHTYATAGTFSPVVTVTITNAEAGTVGLTGSGTALVNVAAGPTANQRFVIKLYDDMLNRPPDQQALNVVTAALDQGKINHTQAAEFVTSTDEYRQQEVNKIYQRFLNRLTDGPALTAFVKFLHNGGKFEDVERTVLASQEYMTSHGNTNDGFVSALYQDVLGRPADDVGKSSAVQKLSINGTRDQLAALLIASDEGRQQRVNQLFRDTLSVDNPPAAKAFTATQPKTHDYAQLAVDVAGSDQYFQKAQSTV